MDSRDTQTPLTDISTDLVRGYFLISILKNQGLASISLGRNPSTPHTLPPTPAPKGLGQKFFPIVVGNIFVLI